ncbi:TPA: hypothetical protein U5D43_004116 [Yersinia enterocolitica]|uniref:hypothetical protein n=1 Tax=Yersinia enterocolitica TaxID=630 RepID=UPI0021E92A83|nr:hypothetical protein [Yersinia enterocolitica]MCV3314151.1 hypothetical protein [Yersinia enterocolitica]UYJ90892.1 hypothetical protein N4228_08285 [Yersinia enterocolitica]UYJ95072.1 hypothetical protein N4225_09065 [Yersinia enterocolitica]UYK24377.1 hypothetical protein N4223_08280 [Yersinia enterocolitica]UYK28353.1 hypothetical protein N4222_08265 [Yersinia enterocolitica]
MNQGIDFSLNYKMDISVIKSIHAVYQVMFKFEQDKIDGTTFYCGVCIGDRHYIVNYSSVDKNDILFMFDAGKIIIDKNDCGADRLFQFATVHPFNDLDLAEMIRLIEFNMPEI